MQFPRIPIAAASLALALALAGCRAGGTDATHEPDAATSPPRRAPLALPPLPDGRHGHRAECIADGRIVVCGGFERSSLSGDRGGRATWILDPAANAWTRGPDLEIPMHFHSSTVVGGAMVVVGGLVQRFDADRDAWVTLIADPALPKSHGAAASVGSLVFAAGGFANVVIDVDARTVEPLPPYPAHTEHDHFSFVASFDGVLHVAGGYVGDGFDPSADHHTFDVASATWGSAAPMPVPDAAKFAAWAADEHRLYVFGMQCAAAYDSRTDAWEPLPSPPWTGYRAMPACFVRDGYLYVLGGEGPNGTVAETHVFDTASSTWVTP